ncbi:hypothetical protein BOX15_Mlig004492g1 [Macrostomum lignano]|uniref:Uncharacterized protein n=1 Tax=Macrostomum lignano TaxID=282301 RepID=A0A267F9J5_9PLAT|nr:hypothetical protein BOX15_Mlig004492g1 [Macrostomum lignano]
MEQSSQPARKFKHYGNRGMRPAMQGETVGENSDAQKDKTIRELRKQLEEKQMDLDSLLQDFDETRHTVYQLNEKVKEYKSRAEQWAQLASSRASGDRGDATATGRLEKLLAEKQVELDSVLEDFDETRHKVYELNEKIKDYERRSDRRDNVANVRADGDVSKLQTQLTKNQEELDRLTEDLDEIRHKVYELNEKVKDYENRGLHASPGQTGVKNGGAEANSMQQADEAAKLQKQLEQKQSELDSVLEDFDETRHKVYELNEKIKTLESGSAQGNSQTEKLQQEIRELKSQAEIDKNLANQLHMEIESACNEKSFKAKKLQAAETEVAKLKEELHRMKELEDELRKQCRESDETVRQVLAKSDESEKELRRLRQDCEAQREALEQHRNLIEQKANLESQLRETIDELNKRNESHAEESEKKLEEKQSELDSVLEDFDETRHKVYELNEKIKNCETRLRLHAPAPDYESDLQQYSEDIEAVNDGLLKQLQECNRQRDSVIEVAEELRNRLLAESRQLTELRQEHSELQADHATLRLAQARDRGHCASLQRQLDEAQRSLRRAMQSAELPQTEFTDQAESKDETSSECDLFAKHRARGRQE